MNNTKVHKAGLVFGGGSLSPLPLAGYRIHTSGRRSEPMVTAPTVTRPLSPTGFTHFRLVVWHCTTPTVAPAPEPGPSLGSRGNFSGRSRSSPAAAAAPTPPSFQFAAFRAASGVRAGSPPSRGRRVGAKARATRTAGAPQTSRNEICACGRPPSRGPASVLAATSAVEPAPHRLRHRREPWMDPGSPLRSGRGDAEGKPGGNLHESQTGAAGITPLLLACIRYGCQPSVTGHSSRGGFWPSTVAPHRSLRRLAYPSCARA